jgi:ankyrin repeat protein
LWHAASGGHNECAELLLERGADPNAMLDASGTALSIAMSRGNERLVRAMYTYGGSLRLDIACYLGKLELAGQLLGLDPSLANSEGDYGPLCMAAGFGHMDIVKLLLRCGADLNAPWYANNYMGYVMEDNLEMARFFLESGADPNLANWQGVTYLHKAAWKGDTAFAKLLLEFNVNLDAVDDEYRSTPLGWAAKYGQAAMVDWLLEHGADPLLPAREEWAQPLAWAKRRGHADIAARLETALAQ